MRNVAVCFSGLMRTYRDTYTNFFENIIKPNPDYKFDIFISTWTIEHSNVSMERTRRECWYGNESKRFPENFIDFPHIFSIYNPISIEVEQPITFHTPWYKETPGVNIQALMNMTYKIYKADILCREREKTLQFKYDYIIRTRFDSIFPYKLNLNQLNLGEREILTPSMMQERIIKDRDWVNDKFAVGSSDNIHAYSNWFNNFHIMALNNIPIQPETMLHQHLAENGITAKTFGSEIELIRLAGY